MAALRHIGRDAPWPRRRPAWMDDHDGGVDAGLRDELHREHVDWQREHDQEAAMYGDRDWDQRVGWTKDAA